MGVVYKTQDLKLKRSVALKFLAPELTQDKEAKERFIQEAQAASALDHPNICTIYEIDEAKGGRMYITMGFCDGESLRERIERGRLEIGEAVDIARQAAEGLARAHAKGIVHRDIKPANIMLAVEGRVKIVDFGLAKLAGQVKLTRAGTTVGTVAYMSPEQARGEETDHRSDIWSLGVVLYEMLSGELPFHGEQTQGVIYSILNKAPKPLSVLRPDIPKHIQDTVARALEKNPAGRYQKIEDMIADLTRPSSSAFQKAGKSIVVLPFEDMSPGKDNEYFSDGLTEEIITDLSHIHDLLVISRSSAMTFKGTKKTIPEIAHSVNVHYVLEGSVRKAGNNLRITAQLIDAVNDTHVWAEKYSGTLDDVFDIQEKVSCSVVKALKLMLTSEEAGRMAERPIGNVAAYDCYLKAKHGVWSFTKEGTERAVQYLQNALDILGENATFYAGLGLTYFQLVNLGIKQEEYLDKAREYVQKAFALDPDSPQAHEVRGYIYSLEGDFRLGISHLKKAASSDPSAADALVWLSWYYILMGKNSEAALFSEKGLQIDPINATWRSLYGIFKFFEGRFDLAVEHLREPYEMAPQAPMLRFWYALSLAYAKRFRESLAILDIASDPSSPERAFAPLIEIMKATLRGEGDKIPSLLTLDVQETFRRDPQLSYHLASFYSFLNQSAPTLDWLENAINRGICPYPLLQVDPFLANIRGDERFKKLMERVKHNWEHFEV
jgi:serine/threonine protein kinase/tetratricopeptide (TPR) repeat protein